MAFVTEFFSLPSDGRSRPHSECTCGWKVVEREGMRVLQLDTYGSESRQDRGTISQSLQLDEVRARELAEIIRKCFPA